MLKWRMIIEDYYDGKSGIRSVAVVRKMIKGWSWSVVGVMRQHQVETLEEGKDAAERAFRLWLKEAELAPIMPGALSVKLSADVIDALERHAREQEMTVEKYLQENIWRAM